MDNPFWRGADEHKQWAANQLSIRWSERQNNCLCVCALVNANHHFTVPDIFREMVTSYSYVSISHFSIWQILTEHLKMRKVCEWWVHKISLLRIWSRVWGQVSNSWPITLLKVKIFFSESLQVMRAGSAIGLSVGKRLLWCRKLQENQHCWSSKNVHLLEVHGYCFLGPIWSPVTQILFTKELLL